MTDTQAPASLAGALAALQAQMPAVGKHATADVRKDGKKLYDYSYAPGEDITPVLYPLMAAVGLSFTAAPTMVPELGFVLAYKLRHTSGEMEVGTYPLPDPGRYGPQDLGKAITYARRYALCALVGLFPGGDDSDANGIAPPGPAAAVAPAQRKAEQAARATPPAARQRRIAEERARADDAGHDPAKVTRTRGKLENDPWENRPPEEREQAPGTVNDQQLRAIWMLLKQNAGVWPGSGHAMARTLLDLPPDALLSDPDENGEVRETFKRLSHAQAADLIKQLQDGAPA